MIAKRNSKLTLIHIAKAACCPDDDTYRELLFSAAGVRSAAKIKTDEQFNAVMEAFYKLGFESTARKENESDWWGCTPKQKTCILGLWEKVGRDQSRTALLHFITRTTGIEAFRFLGNYEASQVITALEKMAAETQEIKG